MDGTPPLTAGDSLTDTASLARELEALHPQCFGWAMACCGRRREIAEDVLHDVYVKVLDGSARYRGESTMKSWLFGVIRKTAVSRWRRERLRDILGVRHAERIDRPTASVSPEDVTIADDRLARTRQALLRLSARQREVVELVFYHDLTLTEAANVMGVSNGSAHQHYHRGKALLAELLKADRP